MSTQILKTTINIAGHNLLAVYGKRSIPVIEKLISVTVKDPSFEKSISGIIQFGNSSITKEVTDITRRLKTQNVNNIPLFYVGSAEGSSPKLKYKGKIRHGDHEGIVCPRLTRFLGGLDVHITEEPFKKQSCIQSALIASKCEKLVSGYFRYNTEFSCCMGSTLKTPLDFFREVSPKGLLLTPKWKELYEVFCAANLPEVLYHKDLGKYSEIYESCHHFS